MIRILLVDDHDLVRTGIRRILEDQKGLEVVADVCDGEQAVAYCRSNPVDVVLMDMQMPGIGGMEATRRVLRIDDSIRVIALTVQIDNPMPTKIMQIGAAGFLSKNAETAEMIKAIRQVHTGQKYLSAEIAQQIALGQFSGVDDNPLVGLSDRELQILIRITGGQKVPDIAQQLSLSPKTVNTYKYRLFEKLDVSSEVELTHLAFKYGLLKTDLV